MRIFFSCITVIFLAKSIPVYAQDQCAIALGVAEDKYEQGRLYEVPDLIKSCIRNGFNDEEKVRAYRLLTLSYLFLNYEKKADSTYMEILKVDPEFVPNDLDPIEIINLSKKFTTRPQYYYHLFKFGMNLSSANVIRRYTLFESAYESNNYSYIPKVSYSLAVGGEMQIWENIHLAGELYYGRRNIHLYASEMLFYKTSINIVDHVLELPIMVKYNFFGKKINPFGAAGISPGFLVNSMIKDFEGRYVRYEGESTSPEQLPVTASDLRKRFNFNVLLGAGVTIKNKLDYFILEARLSIGMLNVTNAKDRFVLGSYEPSASGTDDEPINKNDESHRNLKFPIGNLDDDYTVNNLSIMVGYIRPLYKPRRIK